jgi:hypothetical protein
MKTSEKLKQLSSNGKFQKSAKTEQKKSFIVESLSFQLFVCHEQRFYANSASVFNWRLL